MSKIIIFCGTGRCGTQSLVSLLSNIKGLEAFHELEPQLSWDFKGKEFIRRIQFLTDRINSYGYKYVLDGGAYYLNYVWPLLTQDKLEDIKVICLWRDREKVIKSYLIKCHAKHNFWGVKIPPQTMRADCTLFHEYDNAFPDYSHLNKEDAIGLFWDIYYTQSLLLQLNFKDKFKMFHVNKLNSKEGQNEIYDFLGIPKKERKYGFYFADPLVNTENEQNSCFTEYKKSCD